MEVAVEAAKGNIWEGKASRRHRRRSEKKSFCRIQQEKTAEQEEDERVLDEEEADQIEWLSCSSYFEKRINQYFGSCEDITSLPAMRYTKGPIPRYACCDHALQIFSVQVTEAKNGVEWPLHVYGWVATRDTIDCKRNFLFNRTRDDCQTLTQQDSYLLLTGPSRAVLLVDPVTFQIELKVKGAKESEDKLLSLKTFKHHMLPSYGDCPEIIRKCCSSKYSTIEVAYATFNKTVEATVIVQIIDGAWPDNIRGLVVCSTTSIKEGTIVLLDSRDGRMAITCDGTIELSRRVVSVEVRDQLKVEVLAARANDNSDFMKGGVAFTHQKNGTSFREIDLGFCKVKITVAWSLLSWQ